MEDSTSMLLKVQCTLNNMENCDVVKMQCRLSLYSKHKLKLKDVETYQQKNVTCIKMQEITKITCFKAKAMYTPNTRSKAMRFSGGHDNDQGSGNTANILHCK